MNNIFRLFGKFALLYPAKSAIAILIGGFSALVEGVALTILFPLLDSTTKEFSFVDLIFFSALALVGTWSRFLNDKLILDIKVSVEKQIRNKLSLALVNMRWADYIFLDQADITKSLVMDGLQISSGVQQLLSALSSLLAAFFYFIVAIYVSSNLAILLIIFGFSSKVIYNRLSKTSEDSSLQLSELSSSIANKTSDLFSNMQYIRSTGLVDYALKAAKSLFDNFSNSYSKANLPPLLFRGYFETAATFSVISLLVIQISILEEPAASLLIILALFYRLLPKLMGFQTSLMQCKSLLSWAVSYNERIDHVMSCQELLPNDDGHPIKFNSNIHINNVSYSYGSKRILNNVSLLIPKGSYIAIVGHSGSGKSTLTNLLLGLLSPDSGSISIDDNLLQPNNLQSWRNLISVVLQTTYLANASVAENVALGSTSLDRSNLIESLKISNSFEFVSRLPQQINTKLGDNALSISGGQRQRLSLARAFYRRPKLLILDEATSSLDNLSQAKVLDFISKTKGDLTILSVTHRLETVKDCDQIFVMSEGSIVESGDWNNLTSRDSYFNQLLQSKNSSL